MDSPKTLLKAIQFFSDSENCRQFMVAVRWEDGVVRCPTCNSEAVAYLSKAKVYFCKAKHLKQKFSLKVGTIFEDSPIPLEKWLPAYWLLANCKNGISSYELGRAIGVTQKSAWFMLHRIRFSLKDASNGMLGASGPVEVDETFIGGKPKNMHTSKRLKMKTAQNGYAEKAIVVGLLDRGTREVRATVVPNVKRETLQKAILDRVGFGSTVYTDGWVGYDGLARKQFVHETVNHIEEYVRGEVHTQSIENFWSCLKRTLSGTYVAVEPFHLDGYLDEQMFRFNNRKGHNDASRFQKAVSLATGKRLTHAQLTGKQIQPVF